ncbi:MAG: BON domain-containing protein [Flavobacteriaceae bacterium]|nr:BON domain-containing protein [Flavobacteriaceae bacterium]
MSQILLLLLITLRVVLYQLCIGTLEKRNLYCYKSIYQQCIQMKTEVNNEEDKRDIKMTYAILSIFRWNWSTSNDTIKVKVVKGRVTLSRAVEWQYQKEAAVAELSNFKGVKGTLYNIKIQLKKTTKINATRLKNPLY